MQLCVGEEEKIAYILWKIWATWKMKELFLGGTESHKVFSPQLGDERKVRSKLRRATASAQDVERCSVESLA